MVKVIKSRILTWADHVAKMKEDRTAFTNLQVNLHEANL